MSQQGQGPCRMCRRYRVVYGVGPVPCPVMLIGEGPGPEEDARKVPFIGKSGRELNFQHLPAAGLSRDQVRITNAIKCRQGSKNGDKPYPEDVEACAAHHLPGELRECQPEYVITAGAVALSLFGDHDLELVHGLPIPDQYYAGWTGTVFPVYHPAAGLRKSEFLSRVQEDFRNLWLWRHGRLVVPVDEFPEPRYEEIRDLDHFYRVVQTIRADNGYTWAGLTLAVDTETDLGRFWCLTFSDRPGRAWRILARYKAVVEAFRVWLLEANPLVDFHNWLFDDPVLEQVGIVGCRWTDTMEAAYTLGMAQGLKVLAYRLCGMVMQEYLDLVQPFAVEQGREYLTLVAGMPLPEVVEAQPWKSKKKSCSGLKKDGYPKHLKLEMMFDRPGVQECPACGRPLDPGKMERDKGGKRYIWDRAEGILRDMREKGSNPVDRWFKIPEEEREPIQKVIGEMPLPSIAQVPEDQSLWYACRDADATQRIRGPLNRLAAARGQEVRRAG